jgi:hypothetical protein
MSWIFCPKETLRTIKEILMASLQQKKCNLKELNCQNVESITDDNIEEDELVILFSGNKKMIQRDNQYFSFNSQ